MKTHQHNAPQDRETWLLGEDDEKDIQLTPVTEYIAVIILVMISMLALISFL